MTKAKTERKLQEQAEFINNAVSDAIFRNEFQKENGISIDDAADALERQKAVVNKKITMYIDEQFYKLNSLVNLVVGAANTMAGRVVIDTKNELYKRKDLWRHEIKLNARLAEKAYYDYERLHTRNFGDRYNLFLDYLSAVEDNIGKDVDMLTYSIAQVLSKHNQKDAMLKAQIETARTMCEYACCVFDRLIKEANKNVYNECCKYSLSTMELRKPFDYTPYFAPARITPVFHYWDKVTARLCKTGKGEEQIILNTDPNCKLAFEIIERKLTSEDFLNKAGYDALKLNPECIKGSISDEDLKVLEDKFGKIV